MSGQYTRPTGLTRLAQAGETSASAAFDQGVDEFKHTIREAVEEVAAR